MPVGVHVAVVDPTVGGDRAAVALRTADGRILVGPDNGVLWLACEESGGVEAAVEISNSPWRLTPVSATFHGRDLFAPVAAQLAAGGSLQDAGESLDPARLVRLQMPRPWVEGGALVTQVSNGDRFGNAQLTARRDDAAVLELQLGDAVQVGDSDRRELHRPLRPHVQRRPGGRADPVRGLGPPAGARLQPRQRDRTAGAADRRRGADLAPRGRRIGGRAPAATEPIALVSESRRVAPVRAVRLGTPRVHLRLTDSTNTRARELAAAGGPDGTLVTAAEQSAGRGRQGRTWSAPPNTALLCSLVVREPPQLLSLIAGVAVAATVDRVASPVRAQRAARSSGPTTCWSMV